MRNASGAHPNVFHPDEAGTCYGDIRGGKLRIYLYRGSSIHRALGPLRRDGFWRLLVVSGAASRRTHSGEEEIEVE